MTISYNWLCDYLPEKLEPERLSKILTAVGLEVESLSYYESVKGGLKGLVIGQVLECTQHPNADKLRLTKVTTGAGEPLQIVCGAPNVEAGQKVVVATVGTTIYPINGEPLTMKVAKIRGVESHGMICAEDEIGIGESHAGIMVLPADVVVGTSAADYFRPYSDWIIEIGLTPNRMDAMSHLGVAKDVCAYLNHHTKKKLRPKTPYVNAFKPDNPVAPIKVTVENTSACQRYAGVTIRGVTIAPSPDWMQQRLKAIGLRPINNIVDITNYILHETGQPLHAFDADAIQGNEVIVKNLPAGTTFITLDEKVRSLQEDDLMICNAAEGMCIAGVFGGTHSGVQDSTKNIFLESAWFNPVNIRRTSLHHGLRTDAATRFEKGVDISATVTVLKRAALLIREIAGGEITGEIIDIYPKHRDKVQVPLKYHYLKKLTGKNYHPDTVKNILESLGFEIVKEGIDALWVAAPHNNPDITLPADIVEEILRIDGLDNVEIPASITISPSADLYGGKEALREKMSGYLTGLGFHEILTNSITNTAYYNEEVIARSVKMLNNLSAELNVLRPSMLETALETVAYNINRKNTNLRLYEFGKTYASDKPGQYKEEEHFSLIITGHDHAGTWRQKPSPADLYTAKGIVLSLMQVCGIADVRLGEPTLTDRGTVYAILQKNTSLGTLLSVGLPYLARFDIKQPVYQVDFDFAAVLQLVSKNAIVYSEVSRFPAVQRDLAFIADSSVTYATIEALVKKLNLGRLQQMRLFDVFESEKLGKGKKSLAVNFTFADEEKTLTDKEIDVFMLKIMQTFEKELQAEIRK